MAPNLTDSLWGRQSDQTTTQVLYRLGRNSHQTASADSLRYVADKRNQLQTVCQKLQNVHFIQDTEVTKTASIKTGFDLLQRMCQRIFSSKPAFGYIAGKQLCAEDY